MFYRKIKTKMWVLSFPLNCQRVDGISTVASYERHRKLIKVMYYTQLLHFYTNGEIGLCICVYHTLGHIFLRSLNCMLWNVKCSIIFARVLIETHLSFTERLLRVECSSIYTALLLASVFLCPKDIMILFSIVGV